MSFKIIFGLVALVVSFVGYIPYFRDIFKNKTKPHVFSWLTWSLIGGIVFFAQIIEGAGAGAWVVGLGSIICATIAILAIVKGEKTITKSDWFAFIGAILGLILWRLTSNPLLAIILVTITDALAFIPSFRKAYNKPFEETLITWFFSSSKFVLALIATESYSVATVLYPASLVVSNGSFGGMLLVRRKALRKQKSNYV